MRALLLVLILAGPAFAKDPIMEALGDPAKLEAVLQERKPKTSHLEAALRDWPNSGKVAGAKLLLRAGAKPPQKETDQYMALWSAVKAGDAELVRLLLAAGTKADAVEKDSSFPTTALHHASGCSNGERPEVLAALLDAGASPNPEGGWTPLGRAIDGGCEKHIALLLARGAKAPAVTVPWKSLRPAAAKLLLDAGYRPEGSGLTEALVSADTDTLRLALSSGSPRIDDPSLAYRGLRRALFELGAPDIDLAALIVPKGTAISLCEAREDKSLMQRAAVLRDLAVLHWLLKRFPSQADWTCPVGTSPTPLKLAACEGSPEAAKALFAAGAKQGAVLHDAVRDAIAGRDCTAAGVKALIGAGLSVDAAIPIYGTALQAALLDYETGRKEPSLELIDLLLAAKPRFDAGLRGPLLRSLRWPAVARRLVKAGADINAADEDGQTPLFYISIIHADAAAARTALALELGADPNRANKTGDTPLMRAAMGDDPALVPLLLKHGADPQMVEARGRTALDLALAQNKLQNAQLLRGVTRPSSAASAGKALAAPAPDVKRLVAEAVAEARASEKAASSPAAPAAAAPPVSDVDKPGYSSPEDPDAFAVVVGVEEYSELPKASFAERDAAAVRRHFRALGVPERNLISLTGQKAVRSALVKYLESWLPKNVSERGKVYFYFSGHGAPDAATGKSFLMPWDGDASFLADTAYPVERLYKTLDGLKAKQIFVALDACFSGAGGRSVLPEGARPLIAKLQKAETGRLTVLSAAQSDQITGVIKEQGHGLFTYYLLKGLSGAAAGPGGAVTPESLYSYLKPKVEDEARRQNRGQSPSLSGPSGLSLRR